MSEKKKKNSLRVCVKREGVQKEGETESEGERRKGRKIERVTIVDLVKDNLLCKYTWVELSVCIDVVYAVSPVC